MYVGYRQWVHRDITVRWKEEVLFSDGTRLWVNRERVIEIKPGGEPFQNSRGPKKGRIIVPDELEKVVWDSSLEPMILERGIPPVRWLVIASPIFCEDHYQYGAPKPPYIQFEYVNGKWMHRYVDPKWYGKKSNLLMAYRQQQRQNGQSLTVGQINKYNDPVYGVAKNYLVVDANYKSNCY